MANQDLIRRVKRNPALLRRMLKNPGQRSRLPDRFLTPALRRQRQMNTRLRQPVTPGSAMTERDLARDAKTAMTVKYAPLEAQQQRQVGEAQAWQRDIGGYYDQYLKQVAGQTANVERLGQQAQQAMQGLQAGVTGLAGADLTGIQQPANADAATRGAVAGDVSGMASNAAAIRQALVGSFGAQQATRNNAATRYATTLSNVVAPGQKLQAVAQAQGGIRKAREDQATTARQKGAENLNYRTTVRADEGKSVLARQVANVSAADKAFDNRLDQQQQTETERTHRANEKLGKARITAAQEKAAQSAATAAGKRALSGPFAGLTQKEINGLSTAEARKYVKRYQSAGGGSSSKKDGGSKIDYQTGAQRGAAVTQAIEMQGFARKAKEGKPWIAEHGKGDKAGKFKPLSRHEAAEKLKRETNVKDPVLWTAALDAVYLGGLHPNTVRRLHSSGFKVSEILAALGTHTLHDPTRKNTAAYRQGSGPTPMGHK